MTAEHKGIISVLLVDYYYIFEHSTHPAVFKQLCYEAGSSASFC